MNNTEAAFQSRIVPRTISSMRWLAVLCAFAGALRYGWLWGLAFLLGATAAYLNFTWLHHAVESLTPGAKPPKKRIFFFLALRYALLAAGGSVIVKVFGMSLIAAAGGLLIPAGAILFAIIYELIHDRA